MFIMVKTLTPEYLIQRSQWTHCYVVCDEDIIIGCGAIPASITACEFYRKMGYDYKNGIDVVDEEQLFRLEKFR